MEQNIKYVAFGFIVDDIVYPDGSTKMGMVGGGGPQAAFGMQLWSDSVGLVANVGHDLPASSKQWLDQSGLDLTGLCINNLETLRAWQVLEEDGRRTQVWRVPEYILGSQLRRNINNLPQPYLKAEGYHFGIHPESPDIDFITDLKNCGQIISVETFKPAEQLPSSTSLRALLQQIDIFSPNLVEAISLVGKGTPIELVRKLADLGAKCVSLRMGETGAIIFDSEKQIAASIPSVPISVIDPVGAGNAFCGGFLVGWCENMDIVTAGLYGSVAASFLLERTEVPIITPKLREMAKSRYDSIKNGVNVQRVD